VAHHIVHIAQVAPAAQFPLDEVIKGVQVAISPKLARKVPDR
jgi:hypothetical protein